MSRRKSVGILDVFGFETFEVFTNRIEYRLRLKVWPIDKTCETSINLTNSFRPIFSNNFSLIIAMKNFIKFLPIFHWNMNKKSILKK